MRDDKWKTILSSAATNAREKEEISVTEQANLLASIYKSLTGLSFHIPDMMTVLVFERGNREAEEEMRKKDFDWTPEFKYK